MKNKPKINIRFELFKDYAKENNINVCNVEYMKFIDEFSSEYERIYNRPCLSNQDEFDNLIKYKVLSEIAENTARRDLGIGTLKSNSTMNQLLKKYNISEETKEQDQSLLKRIEFSWERGQIEKVVLEYDKLLEKLLEKYKDKYYKYLKYRGEDGAFENYRDFSYKKDILENIELIEKVNSKVKIFVYWTDESGQAAFKKNTAYSIEKANSLALKSLEYLKQAREDLDMPYISNDIKFSVIIDNGKDFRISKPDDFLIGCVEAKDFYEIIEKHYGKDMLNEIREIESSNNTCNEEEEEETL